YRDDNGQATISSAGNALVGAYLNQLSLPTSAILYITGSPPEGMQWLSFADAQRFSIEVKPFNPPTSVEDGSKVPPSPRVVSAIKNETQAFFVASNRPNSDAIAYFQTKYADEVNYFGRVLPNSAVLIDKTAFFRTQRNYFIELD